MSRESERQGKPRRGVLRGQARYISQPAPASDEPTAIRNPRRGKAHRPVPMPDFRRKWLGLGPDTQATWCDGWRSLDQRDMTERVPLSQTAPEDRCRTCWPTTKEEL